jgi:hypothetical protein
VFFGWKVKVERAPGYSRGLDNGVDIRRVRAGTPELHDGGIQQSRARFAALRFASRRSFWHATIVQHASCSLTYVTDNYLVGGHSAQTPAGQMSQKATLFYIDLWVHRLE